LNRWNTEKRRPEVEAALQTAGIDYKLVVSPMRGGTVRMAEQVLRSGYSPIIVVGGDAVCLQRKAFFR
jgi:diacylglycerol kinase family enzyme